MHYEVLLVGGSSYRALCVEGGLDSGLVEALRVVVALSMVEWGLVRNRSRWLLAFLGFWGLWIVILTGAVNYCAGLRP